MDDRTRLRLQQLIEELEEVAAYKGEKNFGFGVFLRTSDDETPSWKSIEKKRDQFMTDAQTQTGGAIRFQPDPWLEPSSDLRSCIRWWGSRDGVDTFKEWLIGFIALLVRTKVSSLPQTKDVPTAIAGLVKWATQIEPLTEYVSTIELSGAVFLDVRQGGIRFVRSIANYALGGSLDFRPRLEVDLKSVVPSITFDDKTTFGDYAATSVLKQLIDARGEWRTRNAMKRCDPKLELKERLDRVVEHIREDIGIPIESNRNGYRLPTELYLPPKLPDAIQIQGDSACHSVKMKRPQREK